MILSRVSHKERCLYPFSDPISNPCSTFVQVLQRKEIEATEGMSHNIVHAKVGNDLICVKVAPVESL